MKLRLILTLLSIVMLSSVTFTQNNKYLGNEKDISGSELFAKAQSINFQGQIAKAIFSDEKNTYFALDNTSIESRYVKIRILEQSYSDKFLVNIGPDIDSGYMLFLVNNSLKKSQEDIVNLIDTFRVAAVKEEASMNEEAMKLWLSKHKKFSKK
ncbi:MAG: hypothetical protein C0595_07310 [Marinilabiliales bacterium]|nr:MAG: hypothetical protein C0595_07310 [Marinilabiliales bacterium]